MQNNFNIIDLTPQNIAQYGVCGYKDVEKYVALRNKIKWFNEFYPQGLRIKALLTDDANYQGMIEYIPGELAHRPVEAEGYLFIHCLFVGFKKEFKGKGFATALLKSCLDDAITQQKKGVAVVTRKGSFMADSPIFLKNGFVKVDQALPDFELWVFKFESGSPNPEFIVNNEILQTEWSSGITIMRSPQCPYTEKNVNAIIETAEKKYHRITNVVDISDVKMAQNSPCAFGTFCIANNGKIISHHPISNIRFENIMNKL